MTKQQIPNLLTLFRTLAVPAVLIIMLLREPWSLPVIFWIFVAASLTDFLDGYLARKWNAITPLGTMLDPIADKLLVALMLVQYLLISYASTWTEHGELQHGMVAGAAQFLPVLIILLREIYISGLREFLALRSIALPVSKAGKWKTALQMIAIAALYGAVVYDPNGPTYLVGVTALWGAAAMALYSAGAYSLYVREKLRG